MMRNLIMAILPVALLVGLAGCTGSATRDVQTASTRVIDSAGRIRGNVATALVAIDGGQPEAARPPLVDADAEAADIIETTQVIQQRLPDLRDRRGAWARLADLGEWGLWTAAAIAATVLAMYLGLGRVVRPLLDRVGLWIRASTRQAAEFDAKALAAADADRLAILREGVAAKRAADPAYDSAFQAAGAAARGTP